MKVRFTWDPAKAKKNQRVHGISFIGMTCQLILLLVVFVDRSQPGGDVIHLISARKAVDYEKSIYNDQFR